MDGQRVALALGLAACILVAGAASFMLISDSDETEVLGTSMLDPLFQDEEHDHRNASQHIMYTENIQPPCQAEVLGVYAHTLQPLVGPEATEEQTRRAVKACEDFQGMVEATIKVFLDGYDAWKDTDPSAHYIADVPEELAMLPQPGDLWPFLRGWGASIDRLRRDILRLTHATTVATGKPGQPPRSSFDLWESVGPCTRATTELRGEGPATSQATRTVPAVPSTSTEVVTRADIQAMMAAMAQVQVNSEEMRDVRRELRQSRTTIRSLRSLVGEPTRRRPRRPAATSSKAADMECSSEASTSHTEEDGPDETDD